MSGIFSVASHCALQYFSCGATWQVQFGCAHFFVFAIAGLLKPRDARTFDAALT
jgi:hypothetical protein